MISIVISSQDDALFKRVQANIAQTVGVPYEVIRIENKNGKYGICKAYNLGAAQARYDVFCFTHEDVFFETDRWGMNVLRHLAGREVGLIGLAGGDTKSLVPSSWSSSTFESEVSIVQHYNDGRPSPAYIQRTGYPERNDKAKPVICLDGVWMCTRRDVFERHRFDEETFTGFHAYDLDFSLQVAQTHRVYVVFDVILQHYSEGRYTRSWLEATALLSQKWKRQLPLSVRELSYADYVRQHWTTLRVFVLYLIELDYPLSKILTSYFRYSFNRFFHAGHFGYHLKLIWRTYKEKRKLQVHAAQPPPSLPSSTL